MKKKIILLGLLFINTKVYASSVSLSSSASSIYKGGTVTITAVVYSDNPIASIEGTLYCSGAGVDGGVNLNFDDGSNSLYSKTYTYTASSSSTGTITCSTSGVRNFDMVGGNYQNLSNQSVSISVINRPVVPDKTYSSNNNLKSLEIEGYKLDFKKDTLEYSLDVENNIDKIKINTNLEDSNASVTGNGEVSLTEGANKIEIKVTAENGNEKTYIININRKELDAITVKIDNKEYTVIRKTGILELPSLGYEETTTLVNNTQVLAYYSKITKYTLVGLKDSAGNSNYYIYNKDKKTYTLYKEYTFNGVNLYVIDNNDNIPNNYEKTSIKLDKDKINGYKLSTNIKNGTYAKNENDFYLIYAMNVDTGNEELYVYDSKENTVQRYNDSEIKYYQDKADTYFMVIIILSSVIVVSVIILSIILIKRKKNKHKHHNY